MARTRVRKLKEEKKKREDEQRKKEEEEKKNTGGEEDKEVNEDDQKVRLTQASTAFSRVFCFCQTISYI